MSIFGATSESSNVSSYVDLNENVSKPYLNKRNNMDSVSERMKVYEKLLANDKTDSNNAIYEDKMSNHKTKSLTYFFNNIEKVSSPQNKCISEYKKNSFPAFSNQSNKDHSLKPLIRKASSFPKDSNIEPVSSEGHKIVPSERECSNHNEMEPFEVGEISREVEDVPNYSDFIKSVSSKPGKKYTPDLNETDLKERDNVDGVSEVMKMYKILLLGDKSDNNNVIHKNKMSNRKTGSLTDFISNSRKTSPPQKKRMSNYKKKSLPDFSNQSNTDFPFKQLSKISSLPKDTNMKAVISEVHKFVPSEGEYFNHDEMEPHHEVEEKPRELEDPPTNEVEIVNSHNKCVLTPDHFNFLVIDSNENNNVTEKIERQRDWIMLYFELPDKTRLRFEMRKAAVFRVAMEAFCARLGIKSIHLVSFIRPPDFELHAYDTPLEMEMKPGEVVRVVHRAHNT